MTYQKHFSLNFILEQFRRFWWVSALYFVCLFFALPFRLLINADNWNLALQNAIKTAQTTKVPLETIFKINLFNFTWGAECLAFIVVPLLITALLFSYINKKNTIDTIHSLPITRGRLYLVNILSGFCIYTLPIVVTAIIVSIIISILGFWQYIGILSFFSWVVTSLIFLTFFYVFSILIALCTGNTIAMVVLTYFFSLLPFSLYSLINLILSQWFYGFSSASAMTANILRYLSPLVRCFSLVDLSSKSLDVLEGFIYLIIICAIIFFGYIIYKKRGSESATDVLTFKISHPIVKYIIMFCGTILFGTLLYSFSSEKDVMLLIFGYIIGSIIFYMIVQSLIYKDIRAIKKDLKGLSIYLIIFILFSVSLLFDLYGYQKYVPQINDVKTVYFSPLGNLNNSSGNKSVLSYSSKENIEIITNLHNEVLSKKFNESYSAFKNRTSIRNNDVNSTRNIGNAIKITNANAETYVGASPIEYELINGNNIFRSYSYDFETLKKYLPKLFASLEGKRNTFGVFNPKLILPKSMQIVTASDNTRIVNQNSDQIQLIIAALKQDIINDPSPIDFNNTELNLGRIYFNAVMADSNNTSYQPEFSVVIKSYYKTTIDALNSIGVNVDPLSANNISSMEISLVNKSIAYKYEQGDPDIKIETKDTILTRPQKITDPSQISDVFSKLKVQPYEYGHFFGNILNITITFKNSTVSENTYTINNDEIPEFLLQYYKLK